MGDASPARGDDFSTWFIDQFSVYWQSGGGARIEGRIAGYLLISESPGVSAEELAQALGASRGSVSTYIRRLIDRGFVKLTRRLGIGLTTTSWIPTCGADSSKQSTCISRINASLRPRPCSTQIPTVPRTFVCSTCAITWGGSSTIAC